MFRVRSEEVQILLFNRGQFSKGDARSWASQHGFRATPMVHTTASYHRLRQRPSGDFREGRQRTVSLSPGVRAVVGLLKKGRK